MLTRSIIPRHKRACLIQCDINMLPKVREGNFHGTDYVPIVGAGSRGLRHFTQNYSKRGNITYHGEKNSTDRPPRPTYESLVAGASPCSDCSAIIGEMCSPLPNALITIIFRRDSTICSTPHTLCCINRLPVKHNAHSIVLL